MTARDAVYAGEMRALWLVAALALVSCGPDEPEPEDAGTDAGEPCTVTPFELGGEGHADPLAVGAGEARAGRIDAAALPDFDSGLQVWEGGDFVLANEHVAMVIEDAGQSELYDPWGGRPVGVARVEGGALVEPADFGEILLVLGRYTLLTSSVGVMNDGSDGGPAVIRATGILRPLPFWENIIAALLPDELDGIEAAIDYTLEPGARHVDVHYELRPERTARTTTTLHAFMHTPRMPPFAPGVGFDTSGETVPWVGFADPDATSFAYIHPERDLGGGLEISGFVSFFTRGIVARGCAENRFHHARVVIGGPGISGLLAAVHETRGETSRTVRGTVRDASGGAVGGAWVLASDASGFVSRTVSAEDGSYAITLPEGSAELSAFRRGDDPTAPVPAGAGTVDLTFGEGGFVHVVATATDGTPLPVRVQIMPASGDVAQPAGLFGVPSVTSGRIAMGFALSGDTTMRAPAGDVRVVVSRGYEYELHDEIVSITEGATEEIAVTLDHVIDTTGVMCADFHIHTHRSNDSGDPGLYKVSQAIADGLDLPVRSDHEYPGSFAAEIAELGMEDWAYGAGSIEMTSFETWGHFGVFPLDRTDDTNGGAPRWQTYPTIEDPDAPIATLTPVEVFDAVRARPGAPVVIINHPRGGPNYFSYVGFDPLDGSVVREADWDETFTLVEVFNDDSWREKLDSIVQDWLGLLNNGRRVFAVGSSDSHRLASSPVGYPRTCLPVGTDDPRALTPSLLRDALVSGAPTISGGIYVDADVGGVGPGGDASGLGASADVHVRVRAASWVDVDAIDVVVDGAIVETIEILPGDADPLEPTTRLDATIPVDVATAGSYVIVAAYGDMTLEPVHRGRTPFGVTNPIFLAP